MLQFKLIVAILVIVISGRFANANTFEELASNAAGKTLFIKQPKADTMKAALVATADDLKTVFDARPKLGDGFADKQTQHRGGAVFTAKLKDADVNGWMLCGLQDDISVVTVVYAKADASKDDLAALFAALPAPAKTEKHAFPDGSGTIELPAGWTTQSQNVLDYLVVAGPSDQFALSGVTVILNTPDCNILRTYKQNVEGAKRLHWKQMPPDPSKNMTVCPLCKTPDEIIHNLIPAMAEKQRAQNAPYRSIDKVIEMVQAEANPSIPNDQAEVFYFEFSKHEGGKITGHRRAITMVEWYPVLNGADTWVAIVSEMNAPLASFDRDLPIMRNMLNSRTCDPDWWAKHFAQQRQAMADQQKAFERQQADSFARSQKYLSDQTEHFNHFEAGIKAQRDALTASSKDVIEMVRGFRDVYDSSTGKMMQVDYYNVNGIVNGMNEAALDPNRFIQIPLRDEGN